MAAESKIDPMHQFQIDGINGALNGTPFVFTNSALWMMIVLGCITLFMWGGMKRQLVPGRWQVAVESFVEFVSGMAISSIGAEGRKYVPWIFTIFTFILFCNYLGMLPLAVVGPHPFTVTSQFTVTGLMAVMSFSIVLVVGFWKHGLHFFSLFVPKDAPLAFKFVIAPIEFVSFLVRPFSLGLRPFIAMFAGHVLLDVFGNFVVQALNAHSAGGFGIWLLSMLFIMFVSMIELLVAAIQAYVFAILSSLYISEAVNLH